MYEIINHMEKEIRLKIPSQFVNFIEGNRDVNYKLNIDFTKSINQQNLLKETRTILSLIYRDYLCDANKKKELLEMDKKEIEKQEELNREKYKIDYKGNKRKYNQETETENAGYLVEVVKEKWYMKLVNKIKEIFLKRR